MEFQPFFLTGAPKSGTTWLGRLLDAHPQVACRGEACVHHFGLELVKTCQRYRELLARRKAAVTDSNDFPDLRWSDVLAMMRRFIELRLDAIADPAKPALRFVGEKDPEHALHITDLNRLFPEGKLIHIVRDGRGVLLSAWHHNRRAQDPEAARTDLERLVEITAREWSERVQKARAMGRELGERYFELRYEDLVADTPEWLGRTLAFLGADADAATVAACAEAASFARLSQGRVPGQEDAASFFRKGVPDDWKTQLSPAQVKRFNGIAGEALREFGYEG